VLSSISFHLISQCERRVRRNRQRAEDLTLPYSVPTFMTTQSTYALGCAFFRLFLTRLAWQLTVSPAVVQVFNLSTFHQRMPSGPRHVQSLVRVVPRTAAGAKRVAVQYSRFRFSNPCFILRCWACCIRSTLLMHSTRLLARYAR